MKRSACLAVATVAISLAVSGPVAFGSSLTAINPDFSAVAILCQGYAYQSDVNDCGGSPPQQTFNGTPGFGWTLGPINDGLTSANSLFNPPPFNSMPFSQALFLQNANSSAYQAIGGFVAGTHYVLSFYLGSRYSGNPNWDGTQTVQATIDGNPIATWALTNFTPFTLETALISVPTGGTHTLELEGKNPGDHTAFLSGVSISASVPEPSSLIMLAGSLLIAVRGFKR